MRSAAPPLFPFRRARALFGFAGVLAASACSVYSSDLLDGSTTPITGGGSGGVAGKNPGGAGPVHEGGSPSIPEGGHGGESPGDGGDTSAAGSAPLAGTGGTSVGGGGGSAGNSPTAGSAGMVGGGNENLLDNFEDNDLTLYQSDGRGGVWYLFDDGTAGKAGPAPLACTPLTAAPESLGSYALNITAEKFTLWGSGLGVDFRPGRLAYDASKFTGIRFWAKVGATKNKFHRVQIADSSTDPLGMKCKGTADATKCGNHLGANLELTTAWAQYSLEFADLEQIPGWGLPATVLDKSAIYGLEVTAKANVTVDLWLDQIEFF